MSHSSSLIPLAKAARATDPVRTVGSATPPLRGSQAASAGRRFRKAPQSVSGFVAAVLEPTVCVGVLPIAHALLEAPFTRSSLALLLLVMVITFPGPDRFRDPPLAAAADIALSWLSLLGLLLLCGYVTQTLDLYDWRVLAAWAAAVPLVHWALVALGHDVLRWRSTRPQALRTAIVVGAGPVAVTVARALEGRGAHLTRVAGYFDDRTGDRIAPEAARWRLGGLADVAAYVKKLGVAEVYISLPLGSQPRIVALLESLQGTTASLYLVPDLFGISIIQGRLQDVDGVPIVGLCETPFTGINETAKRASDIVIAALALALTAPLMLLLALGVRWSSPGPVIFRQRRNGLGGEEIVVYKFRSMRVVDDGPVVHQAKPGDPRITRFGAFLRRTSLDELPQFVNVLQGRMSIVGPRPHAVAHNEQYAQLIRAYMVRHKVRPGITGWAQVNGHRGETDTVDKMRARVECDLDYLRNWSLGLDLHIILKTIKLIVADRHAY
jgi:putative colanic acid biosysnthesis UDP-glucose lipid carrier transferase